MRPGAKQKLYTWIILFTLGLVLGAIPGSQRYTFNLLHFTLFLLLLLSNQIGLFLQLHIGKDTWFRSPTDSPVLTLLLAHTVLVISTYFGIVFKGFKGYLKGYVSPIDFLLPINLYTQFTLFITLSLRLYGLIFAGTVLVLLHTKLAFSGGAFSFVSGFLLQIVWQGFSVLLGSIQAYVFVTLGMVYTSHKVVSE